MLIFLLSTIISMEISTVISVVMMGAEDTYQWYKLFYGSHMVNYTKKYPDPYTISSPISGVYKHEIDLKPTKSDFFWRYENGNVTVYAYQGRMPDTMEDRFVIDENINNTGVSLYGVFDGYEGNVIGSAGIMHKTYEMNLEKDVFSVDYLAYNLMDSLRNKIINIKEKINDENLNQYIDTEGAINYSKLLRDEILSIDKKLLKELKKHDLRRCGSTALIAIIDGNRLFIANVGDSRAVMCNTEGNATRLTIDHHPNVPEERNRIEVSGGYITLDDGKYNVDGLLTISRCLGDKYMKQTKHVVPDPDVFVYDLSDRRSKFIILTTDGVWINKRLGDQEAIDIINENLNDDLLDSMKDLTELAASAFFYDDNQTIMIIKTPR